MQHVGASNIYAEETLLAWCVERVGAPVKSVEDRRENLVSTNHSRGQVQKVRMGAKSDRTITALDTQIYADLGGYQLTFTPFIPTITAVVISGCYVIPALRTTATGLFTNTFATDAYRGAGRPEGAHLIEIMIDQLASELDLNVLEVRRRKFIAKEDFPADHPYSPVYDSGDYEGSLDLLLEHLDLDGFRADQADQRERGVYRGVGFSTYMEASGLGPSKLAGPDISRRRARGDPGRRQRPLATQSVGHRARQHRIYRRDVDRRSRFTERSIPGR